jgi:hypothetical protein
MLKKLKWALRKRIDDETDTLMRSFDLQQDRENMFSVKGPQRLCRHSDKGLMIPYSFNVIDRDYLVQAVEHLIM